MKKIKRIRGVLAALLAATICMSAVGCGGAPAETTPSETVALPSTPEVTPEATPEVGEVFNITYDLCGGIDGGNPALYNNASDLALLNPLRPGYSFIGWTGSGLSEPTLNVTVAKGTEGELSFKANWQELTTDTVNPEFIGADDGLAPAPELPVSQTDIVGNHGEAIYLLGTIYSEINIDGVMDAAYTYGVHWKSNIVSDKTVYNKGPKASFDVYITRGQDTKVYVYIDVTDSDIVVNSYLFNTLGKPHWNDLLHVYYEHGNAGTGYTYYAIPADPAFKTGQMPSRYEVVRTDKGYAVEFSMDMVSDEVNIGVYLNDTFNWNEADKTYDRVVIKHSSRKNKVLQGYIFPEAGLHDAIRCTSDSASGNVGIHDPKAEKTGDILADIANRAADSVAIVYDENATAQTEICAQRIKKYLDSCGVKAVLIREDKIADGDTYEYYILLGMTDMPETAALIDRLDYNGYGLYIADKAIAMVGWNEEAAYTAYDMLYSLIISGLNGGKASDFGDFYLASTDGIADGDIPKLEGFDCVTDAGEGAYSIYKLVSDESDFTAYRAALEEKGFTLYTTNQIKNVKFATYYNEDTVVNVQWSGASSDPAILESDLSMRIVVEPLEYTDLPSLVKPEDADAEITVSSVAMITPKDKGTSLCMVIQLSNGEFIVIDSGANNQAKDLYDYLKKHAPNGRPVVAAWIMTHFHQDHAGGFVAYSQLSSYSSRTTVKNIIYNFPPQQIFDNSSYSQVDMDNIRAWNGIIDKYKSTGTKVYRARTGQKYYFGNAEVEILWSYEDIQTFNVYHDRSNPTCIGFTVNIAGQRIMLTGDTSTEEFTVAYKKYGDYLKSDMVQLSHHGQGDGGSPVEFYKYVDAKYVFQPGPTGMIAASEKWACDNAVAKGGAVYIRDDISTVRLELPYSGE